MVYKRHNFDTRMNKGVITGLYDLICQRYPFLSSPVQGRYHIDPKIIISANSLVAEKRQTTFWDSKTVMVSTPTVKGHSRIETAFQTSTQEEWTVPCPSCGQYQPLIWSNVIFSKPEPTKNVCYQCEFCKQIFSEYDWK